MVRKSPSTWEGASYIIERLGLISPNRWQDDGMCDETEGKEFETFSSGRSLAQSLAMQ